MLCMKVCGEVRPKEVLVNLIAVVGRREFPTFSSCSVLSASIQSDRLVKIWYENKKGKGHTACGHLCTAHGHVHCRHVHFVYGDMFAACELFVQLKGKLSRSYLAHATSLMLDACHLLHFAVQLPLMRNDSVSPKKEELHYSFIYIAHPRAVTGFSWRKTSRYMPK